MSLLQKGEKIAVVALTIHEDDEYFFKYVRPRSDRGFASPYQRTAFFQFLGR